MDKNFQRQTHFVGVMIPADIQDRIQEFRSYMNERYGCKSGHGTPSHITLIPPFVLPSEFEDGDVKNAVEKAIKEGDNPVEEVKITR